MTTAAKKRKVKIEVTAEDIARGMPRQPRSCPIALACRRAVNARNLSVFRYIGFRNVCVRTPASAFRFIRRFDNGKPVKPFTFTLELPQ